MSRLVAPALTVGVLSASLSACAHARANDIDDPHRSAVLLSHGHGSTKDAAVLEQAVAATGTLDSMTELALARNADLLAERARVESQRARVPAAARRPDLELKYEQWGVPLVRPYALDEADTVMVGLRQSFPAPGVLGARETGAAADMRRAADGLRARELDVARQVERAYLEYWLAEGEARTHRDHVELAHRVIELTRSRFRTGSGTEQDVVRVGVEVTALHRDIARLEQRKRSALAMLNALMGRPVTAPLRLAPAGEVIEVSALLPQLQEQAGKDRPEIHGASHGLERGKADLDEARASALWPTVMVGVDYMYMPFMHERHGYGAMVSISLPWLSAGRRDEVEAAQHGLVADQRAADAVATVVRFEVEDAFARYEAARETYLITRGELVPAAQHSFEAARSGFAVGRGSALDVLQAFRLLLDVRVDEVRDRFSLLAAISDLKRAVGGDVATQSAIPAAGGHHE